MRIVFMGTPDFALASLEKLYHDGHEILAVFTQPDKPKNRGMKLVASPVKQFALEKGLPVYQPLTLKDEEVQAQLRALNPELIAVVAYGRILPQAVLDIPEKGCVNLHGSLLPKYRGAAPIQRAVLNGDKVSGVTTMYMSAGLDSGDIIDVKETEIGEYETAGELFDRLMVIGADLLSETLVKIAEGRAERRPQIEQEATHAAMLSREESPVDWTRPAAEIINQARGLDPWPCAVAQIEGQSFKIFAVHRGQKTDKAPGSIVSAGKEGLEVACGDGNSVLICQLQAAGGRRMAAADYLRGHPLPW